MGGISSQTPVVQQAPVIPQLQQQKDPVSIEGGSGWGIKSTHPEAIAEGVAGGVSGAKGGSQGGGWAEMIKKLMEKRKGSGTFEDKYGEDASPEGNPTLPNQQ